MPTTATVSGPQGLTLYIPLSVLYNARFKVYFPNLQQSKNISNLKKLKAFKHYYVQSTECHIHLDPVNPDQFDNPNLMNDNINRDHIKGQQH